jgi:hypothetical protein
MARTNDTVVDYIDVLECGASQVRSAIGAAGGWRSALGLPINFAKCSTVMTLSNADRTGWWSIANAAWA